MATLGERLKAERESRNTTLEEMVVATGIGQIYLEALEKGEIHELPGKAFGKLYIRAYAEVFGFDPQPWIDDYDREQRSVQGAATEAARPAPLASRPVADAIAQWKAARAAAEKAEPAIEPAVEPAVEPVVAVPEPVPEPVNPFEEPEAPPEVIPITAAEVVVPEPPTRVPTAKRLVVPFLLLGFVVIASAIYFGFRGTDRGEATAPTSAGPRPVAPAPETRRLESPPPVIAKPQPRPPAQVPVAPNANVTSSLTVSEFGVGRRVVNLKLEGESDHFAEGDRVCFASRVLGGQRGDRIRHVWLYEGRVEQSIPLRLGGTDFRTHSNKTLGHAGPWTVEARDDKGGVLARVAFTCVAAAPR
jgi:transcriptional regulator with XRE-family HTH domain